ncbi:Hypothetical predicted protein [Lynx pardinus]|uniref:Uncharacterized protein n=1 Tax=Lynx pardinus TaxID=191816 RepID=A0A485NQL1_LYNPA|nr:Hypothetical predicted protein [Lynx pardinus]
MVTAPSHPVTLSQPRRALPGAPGVRWVCQHALPGGRRGRKSTFQIFGKEVCLIDYSMYPVPSAVREPICCECQARFGGCLPVPRVKAALPYWVPLSLRPRKQIPKMVQFYTPKTTKACPCPCHRFGALSGPLRGSGFQASPCWGGWPGPVFFSPTAFQVVKRQQSFKGMQESPLDLRSRYHCWRVCCDGSLFLKWRQLQALHHQEPPAPGRGESPPAPILPLGLSLLTLLQAVVRVVVAIRQLFWV